MLDTSDTSLVSTSKCTQILALNAYSKRLKKTYRALDEVVMLRVFALSGKLEPNSTHYSIMVQPRQLKVLVPIFHLK